MESDWMGSGWEDGPDPTAAGEIQDAIDAATDSPIHEACSVASEPENTGWGDSTGWGGIAGDSEPLPDGGGHDLSEEEAAALLVDVLSKSAVYVEEGRLRVEPDPAEVEQWSDQKGRDARDIIGQVVAQPENVSLILDALELERPRLDGLMAEYDEVLAQHGNDQDDPEVAELAEQIQDLHTKIQDLTEQYMTLAGLHVPDSRSREPQM